MRLEMACGERVGIIPKTQKALKTLDFRNDIPRFDSKMIAET